MRLHRIAGLLPISLVVTTLVGCQTTQPKEPKQQTAAATQLPRVTALYEKAIATERNVHRFRKPYRDERARILRQLERECTQLLAELQAEKSPAQALTGRTPEQEENTPTPSSSLQTALAELGTAARKGDTHALRMAHSAVLAEYARLQENQAKPPNP